MVSKLPYSITVPAQRPCGLLEVAAPLIICMKYSKRVVHSQCTTTLHSTYHYIPIKYTSIRFTDNFKSVRCDQCLPNCYDVTYSTLSFKTDLYLHQFSVSNI